MATLVCIDFCEIDLLAANFFFLFFFLTDFNTILCLSMLLNKFVFLIFYIKVRLYTFYWQIMD